MLLFRTHYNSATTSEFEPRRGYHRSLHFLPGWAAPLLQKVYKTRCLRALLPTLPGVESALVGFSVSQVDQRQEWQSSRS
jgi:hypothetical protein